MLVLLTEAAHALSESVCRSTVGRAITNQRADTYPRGPRAREFVGLSCSNLRFELVLPRVLPEQRRIAQERDSRFEVPVLPPSNRLTAMASRRCRVYEPETVVLDLVHNCGADGTMSAGVGRHG